MQRCIRWTYKRLTGMDTSELDPENLHQADVACRSFIGTCKGNMAFERVERVQLPSEGGKQLRS